MQPPEAPVQARDALFYLIRHWHDIAALRALVVELAETIRREDGPPDGDH